MAASVVVVAAAAAVLQARQPDPEGAAAAGGKQRALLSQAGLLVWWAVFAAAATIPPPIPAAVPSGDICFAAAVEDPLISGRSEAVWWALVAAMCGVEAAELGVALCLAPPASYVVSPRTCMGLVRGAAAAPTAMAVELTRRAVLWAVLPRAGP